MGTGAFRVNNVSVNYLKEALPLPKVHYSWAFPPEQFQDVDAVDGDSIESDHNRLSPARNTADQ